MLFRYYEGISEFKNRVSNVGSWQNNTNYKDWSMFDNCELNQRFAASLRVMIVTSLTRALEYLNLGTYNQVQRFLRPSVHVRKHPDLAQCFWKNVPCILSKLGCYRTKWFLQSNHGLDLWQYDDISRKFRNLYVFSFIQKA